MTVYPFIYLKFYRMVMCYLINKLKVVEKIISIKKFKFKLK